MQGNIWEESELEAQLFETPESEEHPENVSESAVPQHISTRKRSRTNEVSEAYAIMKDISASRAQRDEYSLFGEQVGIKIRKLPTAHAKSMVQHIIQTTLFEAEMGRYNNPPRFENSSMPIYPPPPMSYPFPIPHESIHYQSHPLPSTYPIPSGSTTEDHSSCSLNSSNEI